jgi:phage baseplate assembly protein W|tara:strand:- start:2251 stop:2661 length:411 start_codon:yes stop_codon:yes gene_type:complete
MAFEIKKINPLDLKPSKGVGVALPFSGRAVFNTTYQTKDAVKSNLINYFLTGKGERYFNPSFGAGLRNLLFNNINESTIDEIRTNILDDLDKFFPRVEVTSLELIPEPDQNLIVFSMRYAIADSNISDEVVINFNK